MSIKIMTRIWDESKQKGSKLLLLLAISDNANDEGFAFPGIEYLAHKTRMSERHTYRLIEELEAGKEIYVNRRGPNGRHNRYIITLGISQDDLRVRLVRYMGHSQDEAIKIAEKYFKQNEVDQPGGDKMSGVEDDQKRGDKMSGGGDIGVRGGVTHESGEPSCKPSLNHINNSELPFTDPPAEPIEESPPEKPPEKPKPLTVLKDTFTEESGCPWAANKKEESFFWSQIRIIYKLAGQDVGRGQTLIKESVKRLRSDELTISGPQSLIKTIRAIIGEQATKKKVGGGGKLPPGWTREDYEKFRAQHGA